LKVDNCIVLEINSSCAELLTKNANVNISGNVTGNVESKNGNIKCGNVSNSVKLKMVILNTNDK
jgi:hypothetical protein